MSLHLIWQAQPNGDVYRETIAILDAWLCLTWQEGVLIDAAWQLSVDGVANEISAQAQSVRAYLLDPTNTSLVLPVYASVVSPYRLRVWQALMEIPLGQVRSYSELAEHIQSGPRAVAGACRDNPFAGIIPCHRAVGKQGIGGFMGQRQGEFVQLKSRLLDYETRLVAN